MLGVEYNCIITSELANQRTLKALFTFVLYTSFTYNRFSVKSLLRDFVLKPKHAQFVFS